MHIRMFASPYECITFFFLYCIILFITGLFSLFLIVSPLMYRHMLLTIITFIRLSSKFPTGALWSVLGQDSLFHIASVYPAVKWVPSIDKAVPRACALYATSCSGISPGGLKWFFV